MSQPYDPNQPPAPAQPFEQPPTYPGVGPDDATLTSPAAPSSEFGTQQAAAMPPYMDPPTLPPTYPTYPGQSPYPAMPPTMPPGDPYGAPPRKRRSGLRLALIIGGVVLVVLLAACGGLVYLLAQLGAPAAAAAHLCTDLKAQRYDAAYNDLGTSLRGTYTLAQFEQASALLDQAEGRVTACTVATNGSGYSIGGINQGTAALTTIIRRETQGDLTGTVHLSKESAGWRVAQIDTSLLGVNLAALGAVDAFCSSLRGSDPTVSYSLLSTTTQASVTKADYLASLQLHDQIDGKISACAISAIGRGNDDHTTKLTADVTRATLGKRSGIVTLTIEGTVWKVVSLDPALLGTDLDPLIVATQFCANLQAQHLSDLYALFSDGFKAKYPQSDVDKDFKTQSDEKWSVCKPDLTTYKVEGSDASIHVSLTDTFPDQTYTYDVLFAFVKQGDGWRINGYQSQK